MGWNGVGVVASRLSCVCVWYALPSLPPSPAISLARTPSSHVRTCTCPSRQVVCEREGERDMYERSSVGVGVRVFYLPLCPPTLLLVCFLLLRHRYWVDWFAGIIAPPPHTHLSPPANLSCVSTLCFLAISLHHIFACCYVFSTPCLHVCMRRCVCLCVRMVVYVCVVVVVAVLVVRPWCSGLTVALICGFSPSSSSPNHHQPPRQYTSSSPRPSPPVCVPSI